MKIDPESFFNFEKHILLAFGGYPIHHEESVLKKLSYFLRRVFLFSVSISFCITNYINIIVNFEDSDVVMETLYFGLIQTSYVNKLININWRSKEFASLIAYVKQPVFNNHVRCEAVKEAYGVTRMVALFYRIACVLTVSFYLIFPFLDGSLLPLTSYNPVDVRKYRIYLFIYQNLVIFLNGCCHSSLDIVCCGLIKFGSAQFDILMENLKNVREGLDDDTKNRAADDDIVKRRLAQCVYHHVALTRYMMKIESLFSRPNFFQFVASSIIICVTGFQMTLTSVFDFKFTTLALFASCNLVEICMFCWFGHDIRAKSVCVGDACYTSDWYKCGTEVRKIMFIIMERSRKPVALTAAGFFALTLQTLVQVLKTAYSYFALLKRINE